MTKRAARKIRSGIRTAQQVMRGERVGPNIAPPPVMYGMQPNTLFEVAYHRTFDRAVRSGRLRPPSGPSGVSPARSK